MLPLHPALVVGYVLGIEQLVGGRILAQAVLRGGTRVHEGLSDDRQTGVGDAAFVDVEHKLWVLDDVHPEPERKAGGQGQGVLAEKRALQQRHPQVRWLLTSCSSRCAEHQGR